MLIDRLEVWPTNGMLGRLLGCLFLSTTKDELRRDEESKCPDLFSRREDCRAKPESLRETGVSGRAGKEPDVGEALGEGGEEVLEVELVVGLSGPRDWSFRA